MNRTTIEDFTIYLCTYSSDATEINVRARMSGGVLTFIGEDYGRGVERFWGEDEYEYFYQLDKENTLRLLELIGGLTDPESVLTEWFSGVDGCKRLRDTCKTNEIKYIFGSW